MKKVLLSLSLMMTLTMLSAQPGARAGMIQDRIEAQRIAFITQKLQLTPEESTAFWPLYNQFRDRQQEMRRAARPERGLSDLTDAEAEKVIADHFASEEALLDLKKEYYQKLKSAIPPRKIARLAAAEMEFNRTVLERIRERMDERD